MYCNRWSKIVLQIHKLVIESPNLHNQTQIIVELINLLYWVPKTVAKSQKWQQKVKTCGSVSKIVVADQKLY